MYLTWLDNNSWLVEMGGQRVLVDPWLVGQLIFNNWEWLFKGSHTREPQIPENIDLIVLSQGLEDHAHPQTLKLLDHTIPVVASANAAKVVKELGYTQVTVLAHGETYSLNNQIEIKATPGSSIGPTLIENGYLFKELTSGLTLYYEPHGFHSPSLKQAAPVDVIITPLIDVTLPVIGSIIRGRGKALEAVQWLQPQVIMHTAGGSGVQFEGFLASLLRVVGSIEEFRSLLKQHNLATKVIEAQPGDRFEVHLQPRVFAG